MNIFWCRCYRDDCAPCMERYLAVADDFDRSLEPGGRLHRKMQQLHELVDRIERGSK